MAGKLRSVYTMYDDRVPRPSPARRTNICLIKLLLQSSLWDCSGFKGLKHRSFHRKIAASPYGLPCDSHTSTPIPIPSTVFQTIPSKPTPLNRLFAYSFAQGRAPMPSLSKIIGEASVISLYRYQLEGRSLHHPRPPSFSSMCPTHGSESPPRLSSSSESERGPTAHYTCRICCESLPRSAFVRGEPPSSVPDDCIAHLTPSRRKPDNGACKTCIASKIASDFEDMGAAGVYSGCVVIDCPAV